MSNGIKEIYNEGRVCGMSSYELYVRKIIESDPSATPPTEQEWLASMLGAGSAMILKITSGTIQGVHDFELPRNSSLCGANTIVGSVFNGTCQWSDTAANSDTNSVGYWATAVTSYGGLILNNDEDYPTDSNIPYSDDVFDNDAATLNIANYCKIADGIIIQQGTWVDSESGTPKKDLTDPQLGSSPAIIRLFITKPLESDVTIIFTGFMNIGFIQSLSGLDGSTNPETNNAHNGGFLGPAIFPWSSKILLIYPNIANAYSSQYERTFPDGELTSTIVGSYNLDKQHSNVDVSSVIDMDTVDPNTYYEINSKYSDSTIPVDVTQADTMADGFNILATLAPGMTAEKINAAYASASPNDKFFPPALYALKTDSTGEKQMVPIDVAAPGTVKMFDNADEAAEYVAQVPNSYALYTNPTTGTVTIYNSEFVNPISLGNIGLAESDGELTITSGVNVVKALALSRVNGADYSRSGSSGTVDVSSATGISWEDLITALTANKVIDNLGSALQSLRDHLPDIYLHVADPATGRTGRIIFGDPGAGSSLTIRSDDGQTISVRGGNVSFSQSVTIGNSLTVTDGDLNVGRSITASGVITGQGLDIRDNPLVANKVKVPMGEAILRAGQTFVTITHVSFDTNGRFLVYLSDSTVHYKSVTCSGNTVTVRFHKSYSDDITVSVECHHKSASA